MFPLHYTQQMVLQPHLNTVKMGNKKKEAHSLPSGGGIGSLWLSTTHSVTLTVHRGHYMTFVFLLSDLFIKSVQVHKKSEIVRVTDTTCLTKHCIFFFYSYMTAKAIPPLTSWEQVTIIA